MQKTLEQLRLLFLEIAQEHEKIDSFYWGNFLQAQKGDSDNPITYPCLVVDVESANLDKSFVGIDLLITIADKVLKGHSNLNDTRSDTLTSYKARCRYNEQPEVAIILKNKRARTSAMVFRWKRG
jgi:hypothetical protein